MQEINLLQNRVKDKTLSWERRNRLIITLFTLILILEILAGAGLFFLTLSTNNEITTTQEKNQELQNAINSDQKELSLAKGLQAQLKNVKTLLNNHIHWSSFLSTMYSETTNKIKYTSISASYSDGKTHLEGIAPSYSDIGKLILSFSTSNNFKDIKLNSLAPSSGDTFGYSFVLEMKSQPELFKK
jgi:hypothetical protein